MFTLDSLDIILSYAGLDRGLNLDVALVSRDFRMIAKRHVDRYRKTKEYYDATFISLDEYNYAKQLLPNIRFLVEGMDIPVHGKVHEEINGGRIIKYRCNPPNMSWTFDTTGRTHSYNDNPAIEIQSTLKQKIWYQHGVQSRKNNNPDEITIPSNPEHTNEKHVLAWQLPEDTAIYVVPHATSYRINHLQKCFFDRDLYCSVEYYIDRELDPSVFLKAYESGIVPEELKKRLLKAPDIVCLECKCGICTHLVECPKCFYVWRHKTCRNIHVKDECAECGYRINTTVPL